MQNTNSNSENLNPDVAPIRKADKVQECECKPRIFPLLLWREQMHLGDDISVCTGWLTLLYVPDRRHTEHGHGAPNFVVLYTDPKERMNDITKTFFGEFIIKAWRVLHADEFADLPKTHDEWRIWESTVGIVHLVSHLTDHGIYPNGMTDDQVFDLWDVVTCNCRKRA